MTESGPRPLPDDWQDTVRLRRAVEVGVVCLAAERGRAEPAALAGHLRAMGEHVATMDAALEDFPVYRRADVGFHLALAEATAVRELVLASTRVQDAAGDLIAHISHPPAVLAHANEEHRRIRAAVAAGDRAGAIEVLCAHLEGTDLVLRGLAAGLPEDD